MMIKRLAHSQGKENTDLKTPVCPEYLSSSEENPNAKYQSKIRTTSFHENSRGDSVGLLGLNASVLLLLSCLFHAF